SPANKRSGRRKCMEEVHRTGCVWFVPVFRFGLWPRRFDWRSAKGKRGGR
ncbi:hypothetical protein B0F90DRAFT_1764867, partial [Multifurca ochricompacta]